MLLNDYSVTLVYRAVACTTYTCTIRPFHTIKNDDQCADAMAHFTARIRMVVDRLFANDQYTGCQRQDTLTPDELGHHTWRFMIISDNLSQTEREISIA